MSQVTEQSVRFQTAFASIKLIQASAVLDLTEDDFDFLTSNKVWIATDRYFLNEWEAFKKVISRRNIRRRITIPLTLSNLKLLRRITRTENILHRNFTRRQVAI